jgi:hypothetical protein
MSTDKTFDDIAAAQGWNSDSRETVLRSFIDRNPRTDETLAQFAQAIADEENGVTALPHLEMDVPGEYSGNAYPERHEYRIKMVVAPDSPADEPRFLLDVQDHNGSDVGQQEFGPEEAEGIIKMASTDQDIGGYEDDWKFPAGMLRALTWTLQTDMDHEVVLNESHVDEVAAWLRYATGEETWDGGDSWEF